MKALRQNGASPAENAVRAIATGCDMVMCSLPNIYPLIEAIAGKARTDTAFARRLDEAASRVLTAKHRAGIIRVTDADAPVTQTDIFPPHVPNWETFRQAKAAASKYAPQ